MSDNQDTLETSALAITFGYVMSFCGWAAVYALLHLIWGEYELLKFSDIGGTELSTEGLSKVWFIFVWAFVATGILLSICGRPTVNASRGLQLARAWWVSINAGVFEELIYRWLLFFGAMITLPFFNLITFGLVKWVYTVILVPLANLTTFGALEPWLLHQGSWVFGAAIVSANIAFRNGHEHLGIIGWINSWFMGMVLFYLVLNYGLVTAIVAHAVYDIIVFTMKALVSRTRF